MTSPYEPNAHEGHPNCIKCGLFDDCRSPFMQGHGAGVNRAKKLYLIVGEAPGKEEDKYGTPFHPNGDSGDLLRTTLLKHLKSLNGFIFTNAVRCHPPGNKLKGVQPRNCCRQFLLEEIEEIQPDAILLCGGTAYQSLFKKGGITKARRQLLSYQTEEGIEIPCVAAFHPSYALRDANQLPLFEQDIKYFCDYIAGKSIGSDYDKYVEGANLDATVADIRRMHKRARDEITSHDVESNSLRPEIKQDFRITCAGFYNSRDFIIVRLDTKDGLCTDEAKWEAIEDFLTDPECMKVAHNAKYELHAWASRRKIRVENLRCSQILHSIVNPYRTERKLDVLGQQYVGVGKCKEIEPYLKEKTDEAWLNVPPDILTKYNAGDCRLGYDIYCILEDQLYGDETDKWKRFGEGVLSPEELYEDLMTRVMYFLQEVETRGLKLDLPYLKKLEERYIKRMEAIQREVNRNTTVVKHKMDKLSALFQSDKAPKRDETKRKRIQEATFNIGSDAQVREVLFGRDYFDLDFDPRKVTDKGQPQVDQEVIEDCIIEYEGHAVADFCKLRQEYKSLDKNVGTYIHGLTPYVDKRGYVHGQYNQDVATTGRLSSSRANLQNQKGDTDLRRMFVAPKGWKLVEFDFSQVELRILAAYSGDEDMIGIYARGEDLHAETQAVLEQMGVFDHGDYPEYQKRTHAKRVNFGIIYLISPWGLSKQLGGEELDTCQNMIDGVYRRFPAIEEWQEEIRQYAAKYGRVYNMFGGWRQLTNCQIIPRNDEDERLVEEAMRQAVNAPIQGTASHCNTVACLRLNRLIKKRKYPVKFVNLIHDAGYNYVRDDIVEEFVGEGRKVMEKEPVRWLGDLLRGVPIKVDAKVGPNWAEMEKV